MASAARRGIDISVAELMAIREEVLRLPLRELLLPESRQSSQGLQLNETRGMEYRESRAYVVGDDFRSIDWRAMARSGEAYTKIFSDQLEQTVMIAIDLSPSLYFGTRYSFKSWTLARLAAMVGWLCDSARLPVECLLASQSGIQRITLGSARRNLPQLFSVLSDLCHYEKPPEDNASQLNNLLAQSCDTVRVGSRYFLLSDCLGIDEQSQRLLKDITRSAKTSLCRVSDQTETGPWPNGTYQLQLGKEQISYRLKASKRQSSLQQIQATVAEQINRFMALASHQISLSCNDDIAQQLQQPMVIGNDPGRVAP